MSVGPPQDGYLCLWDWQSGLLVKKLKLCSSVASVAFSADAKFILTAGKRHIKIFTVGFPTKSRPQKTKAVSLTMHEKTINLAHHKSCTFIGITSPFMINGKSGEVAVVYALTDSGISWIQFNLFQFVFAYLKYFRVSFAFTGVLCLLHGGLTITHLVNLKVNTNEIISPSQTK